MASISDTLGSITRADVLRLCQQQVGGSVPEAQLVEAGLAGTRLVEAVMAIVWRNLQSGRAGRVIANYQPPAESGDGALRDYVDRVIKFYLLEHQRVERLAARDNAEWRRLHELLTRRAYRSLQQWRVASLQPKQEAVDFAQLACESIFQAAFPYDVPFDAWATVILKNHIRQRYLRSHDIIDRNPATESLDQSNGQHAWHDVLADGSGDTQLEQAEVKQELIAAISSLSSQAQQDVVIYSFLYELSDDEIAQRLGRTKQAVYNLRYRALCQLKEILYKQRERSGGKTAL